MYCAVLLCTVLCYAAPFSKVAVKMTSQYSANYKTNGFLNFLFSHLGDSFGPRTVYMIPLNQKETLWW